MGVELSVTPRQPTVAHVRIDFDDLNLLTEPRVSRITDTVTSVPGDVSVVTIGADQTHAEPDEITGLSGGIDLSAAKELTPHEAWDQITALYSMIQTVRDLDAVTVCSCGDYALGGGFELAIACDFRIATPDARLGLPEVNVGIPTVIMGGLLIRHVGVAKAKELIYTGETFSGDHALDLGLVTNTAGPEGYDDALDDLVMDLAAKSPMTMAWQKRVFRAWRNVGLETGMQQSIGMIAQCFGTHDQREAMEAFLDKREPIFHGD